MIKNKLTGVLIYLLCATSFVYASESVITSHENSTRISIPRALNSYGDQNVSTISEILRNRITQEPFNLAATLVFLFAVLHTFFATKFTSLARKLEKSHKKNLAKRKSGQKKYSGQIFEEVNFKAYIVHYLGEVEVVFGLWAIVLAGVILYFFNWHTFEAYLTDSVKFTEPLFVVVIMVLASSRPILRLAENSLEILASLGGKKPVAWWFVILTLGPLLGSFITEAGAMTISAILLARQFYDLKPSPKFAYATIGLLFVNVSVGGTLSHFAAPPVLMVAGKWGWDFSYMFTNFGVRAIAGILLSNILYLLIFRKEFANLEKKAIESQHVIPWVERKDPVPFWITLFHILFMAWTVFCADNAPLFIGGFLFYLGFYQATLHHQNRNNMRQPLMVGFFLAALVVHAGLQGWWLAVILDHLSEVPLMLGATVLTSFNDNAAITYLSSLAPDLSDKMRYSVMAGAVTGGGLTVIANAPNPAGQAILSGFFENGVSPLGLAAATIIPTILVGLAFMVLK